MGGHQVGVQRARAAADNSYNQDVDEEPSFVLHVPFNVFYDLIKKSFVDSATPSHIDAILKRACFLVNTKTHVFYRMAGINTDPVHRVSEAAAEYLTDAGKQAYGRFKAGNLELPEDFASQVQIEQDWVSALMKKRIAERGTTKKDREEETCRKRIREQLFGDTEPEPKPCIAKFVEVKQEKFEDNQRKFFEKSASFSQSLKKSTGVIDLHSPPRPSPCRAASLSHQALSADDHDGFPRVGEQDDLSVGVEGDMEVIGEDVANDL